LGYSVELSLWNRVHIQAGGGGIYKVMPMIEKNAKECKLQEDINNSEIAFYGEWEKIAMRNFQNTQSQRDFDMYKTFIII
jgi:hypothetical protein